jgi:peroxiredoxin family protein
MSGRVVMCRQIAQCSERAYADMLSYIDQVIAARLSEYGLTASKQQAANQPFACDATIANRATIVVFSGDMDRLLAAFSIATGAVAMGMEVSMFFTFWGLTTLKKKTILKGKTLSEKLIALMLSRGPDRLGTSRMNMLGIGPVFFKRLMRKKNVQSLPDMLTLARDLGVRMVACRTSMDMMGIGEGELIDGIEFAGVATYLADARSSRISLFV